MAIGVKSVTDQEFKKEVLDASQPTLVDFWAEWCGPCRAIAPIVEELAKTYTGRMQFAKMNVDENRNTPSQYGIKGIPTLLLFKGGKVVDQIVGAVPKQQLVQLIERSLSL